ncbi:Ldh family oxidoreductase [Cupriavidus basilensis]|uniref:Ldh family oxidoreductase n=1 Tax=Cupriavidus basilensis TaxID=68895 RepID=UPI0020A67FBA|nr:Ldh family oxidoreductase [Cupriavidus basilensis]MCP3024572.1 Ldh family oxidoreductase [Cupriavidus basilensis]
MTVFSAEELERLAMQALRQAGAGAAQAVPTARALVLADLAGLPSHGVSRVPMYVAHLRHKRVEGNARPTVAHRTPGTTLIDAQSGFAFPACAQAVEAAIASARECGIGAGVVANSHHFGAAALHLAPVAQAGMIGIAMGNSPAAMPAWGGRTPLFGTNPIAAVFPRRDADALVIDLSLSEVARGKIMVAAKQGKPIPLGWALDAEGNPTTDAQAALHGAMLPAGGVKGAMLALLVEMLIVSLAGAHFGAEADSFFEDAGNRPRIGQLFLAFNPRGFAGDAVYHARLEALVAAMLSDSGTRLPGTRRAEAQARARQHGIEIPETLEKELRELANA